VSQTSLAVTPPKLTTGGMVAADSGDAAHAGALSLWRGRLIEHLSVRGERFVKGGRLALRPDSHTPSANFPSVSEAR